MEARDSLSAMGFHGALRLWRAAIRILSACVVDTGRFAQCSLSLDRRGRRLHMDRAGSGRRVDVCARAAMA